MTPTGAALLRAAGTVYGPAPPMEVRATGYGAGGRELPGRPNVMVAVLGRPVAGHDGPGVEVGPQVVLSTNLDDVTGEVLGHVIERALAAGAADAWITPAVMKKGRPAHVLHVLAPRELAGALRDLVLSETGSLGLRLAVVEKVALPRQVQTVRLHGHDVRVKHGPWGAKPEHDDLARLAEATGRPLRELAREALRDL